MNVNCPSLYYEIRRLLAGFSDYGPKKGEHTGKKQPGSLL